MNDGSLGAVVHGLQLRDVDDAAAHRRRRNEAAGQEVLQRLSIESRALVLLSAEVSSSGLGAPHDTVYVDRHDLAGLLSRTSDKIAILPSNARVGDEDVQAAVELLDNFVDGLLDGFDRDDVYLVRLA